MADGRFDVDFGPTQSGGVAILIEKSATEALLVFHAAAQTVTLAALFAQSQQHQSRPPAGRDVPSGDAVILIEQDTANNLMAFYAAAQTVRLVDGFVVVSAKASGGVTPPVVTTTALRPQKGTVLAT